MGIITKSQLNQFTRSTRTFSATESAKVYLNESKVNKRTVFLSHKHDEKIELDSAIGLLKKIKVDVYVDWLDSDMPKQTSGVTATRIKEKIKENKKFILLATEGAIDSKWCNWELGFGDAHKFVEHIALLPIRDSDRSYSGSEYLQIYPSIVYFEPQEQTWSINNAYVESGYYVVTTQDNGNQTAVKLSTWLDS